MTGSLAGKSGACHRWKENGLICNKCDWCFHINCASTSPNLINKSMSRDYMSCRYQKHALQQEGRIKHLEQEVKAARCETTVLKAVISSSSIVEQANLNDWIKPKNSKASGRRFSADDAPQIQLRDSMCWKQTQWKMSSRIQVCWSKRSGESTQVLERKERKIVLVGSSHGREMGTMLQENLGSKFEVCSIFKPNAPLAKVAEDVREAW